jgi:hypothetical protein
MWITVLASFMQQFPESRQRTWLICDLSFIGLAAIASAMLLRGHETARAASIPREAVSPSDRRWNVGAKYWATFATVPVILIAISVLSMAMQDGPSPGSRLRFGPNAYWRQATAIIGKWNGTGEIKSLEFKLNHSVEVTLANSEVIADMHSWHHADSVVWLEWYARDPSHPGHATIPLSMNGDTLSIQWPGRAPAMFVKHE